MKQVVVLLAVLAMGFAATFEHGFRVTYGAGLRPGKDFFYGLPLTKGQAIEMEWTQYERPPSALPSLEMFCPVELNICIMYDPITECVAGLQVAVSMNTTTDMPYNWSIQGFVPWTPPVIENYQGIDDYYTDDYGSITYMTKQLYFVTEESLSVSDVERLENAGECKALQQDAVWISGFNQELIKVGTTTNGIVEAGFTKQKCFPWKGTHYYYRMTKTLKCTAKTFLNWFMLVDSENLIGLGFVMPGKVSPVKGQRFLFEQPSSTGVKLTIQERPECLDKLSRDPTLTTMHIYFIDEPWKVGCWLF